MISYPLITAVLGYLHRITDSADVALFRHINGVPHIAVLNSFMTLATLYGLGVVHSGICLGFIVAGLTARKVNLRRAGYAGLIALLMSLIAVAITKGIWNRPRPLLELFDVNLVNEQLFTRSFPSGHSSTAFAVALAYSAFLPRLRYPLLALAFAVALSRVYLGVHFPLDTLYGGLMGAFIGIAAARIVRGAHSPEPAPQTEPS